MSESIALSAKYNYGDGFQIKVLGLALRDPGFLQSHADLIKPQWFERDALVTMAHLIVEYFKSHGDRPTSDALIALIMEHSRLYGGDQSESLKATLLAWVKHLYEYDLSDSQFVTDKMVKFGQRQAFKAAISRSLDMLDRHEEDPEKFRSIFDEALRVGSVRQFGTDFKQVAPNLYDLMMNDPVYGMKWKVPTGIRALDQRLYGGLGAGEIMVVAGPPGRGKSTMLINILKSSALHFATSNTGKSGIFITLELKETDCALKLGACITGVEINEILQNSATYNSRIKDQMALLGNSTMSIKYFSPGSVDVEEIRWFIANLQSTRGIDPGIIIVDYADKIRGGEDDSYRKMGVIYDQLIAMGDKFKCPVVTGSQVNREWSDEEVITNRGISDSWKKVANADVIVTLCQTPEEHQSGVMRLFLSKVRRGEDAGQIFCHWKGARAAIWECTADEIMEIQREHSSANGNGR